MDVDVEHKEDMARSNAPVNSQVYSNMRVHFHWVVLG